MFVELIYKMQRVDVSGAVRPLWESLGVKGLISPLDVYIYQKGEFMAVKTL